MNAARVVWIFISQREKKYSRLKKIILYCLTDSTNAKLKKDTVSECVFSFLLLLETAGELLHVEDCSSVFPQAGAQVVFHSLSDRQTDR